MGATTNILTFAENGYIAGDGTGNYLPNQIMTRAQFAAVINRVMGYTEESPSIANYTDVEDSAWYRSDLAKALSAGYMSGTSATTMSLNQPVTREQAAVMIVRLFEENTSVDLSVLDDFTDRGDISAFAVNAMAKLISDGYLYGADGKLMPQKSMTRAEGIALLSRSMDALKDTNLEEEKEETKTEEKDNSNKGSSGGSSGGGSSSGGGGSSSGGGGSSKPSQNIAKVAQTKLVDLGRSQYVVVSFEEGFSKDNTKLIIDGVDVTSNFTNVDDDGTIVKWELTSLNPAKLVLESGNSKQEVKLTNNQNPEKPESIGVSTRIL
ncbi:S-layer homology domain-containing protein [Anaerotignum lactatifermentans]|uniref:S-layer homology domain-containing protein n=1 Tax=Anaerotignum lactatifermentans TaxID=160404 RepID=UPI003AB15563